MTLPSLDQDAAELLRALTQVSHAVSNAESLEPIMRLAADQAASLLGASRSVVLLTEDDGSLRIRAWHGPGPTRIAVCFRDRSTRACRTDSPRSSASQSPEQVLAVPLIVRGRVTGIIATPLGQAAAELRSGRLVLTALADQMAAPIENARMAEEVRQAQLVAENARLHQAERTARLMAEGRQDVARGGAGAHPRGNHHRRRSGCHRSG